MKKILLVLVLFLLVGCSSKQEDEKYAYLEYKSDLEEKSELSDFESNDFNTYFALKRIDEETISYSITIDKPSINMHKVKALLIHDYVMENVYPSVGIFDEPVELLKDSGDKIVLKENILATEDINGVNFKLYLEYTDDDDNVNKIYYAVQRG